MNDRTDDHIDDRAHDRLRTLVADAADGVEPTDRLAAIRERTAGASPGRARRWSLVAAAAVATAAVLGVIALVLVPRQDDPDPAPPVPETRAVGLYFLGETPQGTRLFREFQQLDPDPLAALEAITAAGGPDDPDYTVLWPAGTFTGLGVTAESIEVSVADLPISLDMSDEVARLGIQQVIHTAQSATGSTLPVRLVREGRPVTDLTQLVGVTVTDPLVRAPQLDVLALVSVSDPAEGAEVTDGLLVARGRAGSFEATVPWQLLDASGAVALEDFVTADGWGDRLYAWETEIDVSGLSPGTYTFVASTSDPSGGAEGAGPTSDTHTVVVP